MNEVAMTIQCKEIVLTKVCDLVQIKWYWDEWSSLEAAQLMSQVAVGCYLLQFCYENDLWNVYKFCLRVY